MGTFMAPKLRMVRSAIDHSGRFSERSAMRSPGLIPKSARPWATFRTRSTNVSDVILIQSLPTLWLSASCFPCFRVAVRQSPGSEEACAVSRSLLISNLTEAVEAKLGAPPLVTKSDDYREFDKCFRQAGG